MQKKPLTKQQQEILGLHQTPAYSNAIASKLLNPNGGLIKINIQIKNPGEELVQSEATINYDVITELGKIGNFGMQHLMDSIMQSMYLAHCERENEHLTQEEIHKTYEDREV